MELTFESAFSTGGLVGHTSYLLLVISMLMRRMWLLRILVILSALVAITYDLVWLKDPVGVFWETLLVAVNVIQLSITYLENTRAKFSEEEAAFVTGRFPTLDPADRRKLLNRGLWVEGEAGTQLSTEGQPVDHLIYLSQGEALVKSAGRIVAVCEQGAFVGEMTVLSGEPATGTVVLSKPSRYWLIEAGLLREQADRKPEIRQALESGFSRNLREKLVRSNRFIVDSGGVMSPSPPGSPAADRSRQ